MQKVTAFFHIGKLPNELRAQMELEGRMVYLAEGIGVTAIFRDFKAQWIRCVYRRMTFIGFLALSERRIVVQGKCYNEVRVNATYDDATFKKMIFRVKQKYLSVTFDASDHLPNASGQIELRLHLPDVSMAARFLEQRGASVMAVVATS